MTSGVMIFLGEFRIETLIGSGGEAPVTKVSMSRLTTGYEVSREEERKKHHLFSHVKPFETFLVFKKKEIL